MSFLGDFQRLKLLERIGRANRRPLYVKCQVLHGQLVRVKVYAGPSDTNLEKLMGEDS